MSTSTSTSERASQGSLLGSATVRKARPPILKRTSNKTAYGALLGSPRREQIVTSKPEEAMAACFLQYCAMCEKQISTPFNSILYCSEACRRKDSKKPLSAANIMSASPPSTTTPSSPRAILQPRTPTGVTPSTFTSVERIPTDNHSFKSDLDPTEWKPKLRPSSNRYNSEAFRYLSSFHRALHKTESGDYKIDVPDMSATVPTTPSLGNTPTTTASSWSMSTSAGYDYVNRPLMPRHNRWYSSSGIGGQGIDLVTPHIAPPVEEYAKKDIVSDSEQKGALGAFFGGVN